MKQVLVILFMAISTKCQSQTVSVMDFVKVKEGRNAEAMFFYEQNWKMYRDIALKKGFITGYRIEKTKADSSAAFNLILITEYKDSSSQANSEANFSDILKTTRPNGPVLLNELKPEDFRENLFVKITSTLHNDKNKRRKKN